MAINKVNHLLYNVTRCLYHSNEAIDVTQWKSDIQYLHITCKHTRNFLPDVQASLKCFGLYLQGTNNIRLLIYHALS